MASNLAILIAYHSSNQSLTHEIGDYLTTKGNQIYLISDRVPEKVSERAKLVQVGSAFLVIADRNFQKSSTCLELLHFARDLKKPIFGININPTSFVPFGPLGAIIAGTQLGFFNLTNSNELESCLSSLIESLKNINANPNGLPQTPKDDFRSPTPNIPLDFVINKSPIKVLISTHSDSIEIARIVEEGLSASNIESRVEETSSEETSSVASCKVLVVIMSPGYEADVKARLIVEKSRSLGLRIVPVSKTREWKPKNWLGLTVAGVLFFRIYNRQKAYEPKYDSNPMKDLVYEVG